MLNNDKILWHFSTMELLTCIFWWTVADSVNAPRKLSCTTLKFLGAYRLYIEIYLYMTVGVQKFSWTSHLILTHSLGVINKKWTNHLLLLCLWIHVKIKDFDNFYKTKTLEHDFLLANKIAWPSYKMYMCTSLLHASKC